MLTIQSIFGVCVGFEYLPAEVVQDMTESDTAKWGFLIDLFAVRLIYISLIEE